MTQKTTNSPAGSGGRRKQSRCCVYGGQHRGSAGHVAAEVLGPVRGSDMAAGEGQTGKAQAGRRGPSVAVDSLFFPGDTGTSPSFNEVTDTQPPRVWELLKV